MPGSSFTEEELTTLSNLHSIIPHAISEPRGGCRCPLDATSDAATQPSAKEPSKRSSFINKGGRGEND